MNAPRVLTETTIRAAIVGTGYIADYHARGIQNAPGAELVGVCDAKFAVAEAFASAWGVPAYSSMEAMLAEQRVDVVHILVPPDLHFKLAKPPSMACTCSRETDVHFGRANPRACSSSFGQGADHRRQPQHAFRRRISTASEVSSCRRSRPDRPCEHQLFHRTAVHSRWTVQHWMLREPGNALLEIGPHPISGLVDLVGVPDKIEVKADRDIVVPGGARVYRRWRIRAEAGRATADVNIDLAPGFPQRTIAVRGLLGAAFADLDANTCTVDRRPPASPDFERRKRSLSTAAQLRQQAQATFSDYLLSKAKMRKRGIRTRSPSGTASRAFMRVLVRLPALTQDQRRFWPAVISTCESDHRQGEVEGRRRTRATEIDRSAEAEYPGAWRYRLHRPRVDQAAARPRSFGPRRSAWSEPAAGGARQREARDRLCRHAFEARSGPHSGRGRLRLSPGHVRRQNLGPVRRA